VGIGCSGNAIAGDGKRRTAVRAPRAYTQRQTLFGSPPENAAARHLAPFATVIRRVKVDCRVMSDSFGFPRIIREVLGPSVPSPSVIPLVSVENCASVRPLRSSRPAPEVQGVDMGLPAPLLSPDAMTEVHVFRPTLRPTSRGKIVGRHPAMRPRHDPARRRVDVHGPHYRGERNRQGAGRSRVTRCESASREAARDGELRGHS